MDLGRPHRAGDLRLLREGDAAVTRTLDGHVPIASQQGSRADKGPAVPSRAGLQDAMTAARTSPAALLVLTADGVVVAANAELCRLVGRSADELAGCPATAVAASGTADVLRAAAAGQPGGQSTVRLRAVGEQSLVLSEWSVVHGAAGTQLITLTGRPQCSSPAPGPALRGHVLTPRVDEDRSDLAAELRDALRQDELAVHYQPVVEVPTGRVLGVEALARWTHATRGDVSAVDFIAVAESTGLATELDCWVLQRALRDMSSLLVSGAVPPGAFVAVNLSARDLCDSRLDRDLPVWTARAGLAPAQVVLELTETAVMRDAERAVGLLRRLRARGFGVAVDDFGTGYSSLAYLRDLPITALKIDRSFVADITTDPTARAIVASIVGLGRAVGVIVIAEGVETAEQAAVLTRLGCSQGQGWLWGAAVPPPTILSAFEAQRSGPPERHREA